MPLLPRWRYMTPEAKALTRKVGISTAVVLFGLVLLRTLLPWMILALIIWWVLSAMNRQ
ncbi:MAG: hypothetical protein ISP81_10260 [Synechococcus sp. BS301-5m-G54]|nr:hypothetical protein [Synechococcus sp. BS301-5m-G54]MBL6796704.1 hypothetical protein [Synechococcus sp. BS307-5m-G34]